MAPAVAADQQGAAAKEGGETQDGEQTDVRVSVYEVATGRVLSGEEAPLSSQLDAWLEMHPG